jgi:membrane-bound lytic murein transglycosylase A
MLRQVGFDQIPGWSSDDVQQTLPALRAECHRLALLPADTALGGQGLAAEAAGKAGLWTSPCAAATLLTVGDEPGIRRFYELWFQPYQVTAAGLFSGYYEPEVQGSTTRSGAYQTPLLARPTDLVQEAPTPGDPRAQPVVGRRVDGRLVPYWSRADIEAGRIGTAARPLFWLADPVDLFFLQIQGAGRIRLPDGSVARVAYDGKNGRPYTPIGRVLMQNHALAPQDVSMQSIRAWLAAHPAEARQVMDQNEDYVFFRVLPDADAGMGPPGALGVELQPGRTAAVDIHTIPLAAPIFLDTTNPVTGAKWQHLLLAQDLGTDIKGPARTDVFLGAGDAAEQQAGRMRQPGTEYVLLPRQVQ